jgi:hypothetical protein
MKSQCRNCQTTPTVTYGRAITAGISNPAERGSEVSLHSSNPEPLTSALGQKRTLGQVHVMSALPPKADMDQHSRNVRFVP